MTVSFATSWEGLRCALTSVVRPVHSELVAASDAVDIICDQILDAARAEDATTQGEAA